MSNEVQKFDPATLMDGVRDRIKATFVSLIPEEHWEAMIQRETDAYFKPRENYRDTPRYSDFQLTCQKVMTEICEVKIREALLKYENHLWGENEVKVGEILMAQLQANASQMFAAMIGSQVQKVINDIKNRGY